MDMPFGGHHSTHLRHLLGALLHPAFCAKSHLRFQQPQPKTPPPKPSGLRTLRRGGSRPQALAWLAACIPGLSFPTVMRPVSSQPPRRPRIALL